MNGRLNEKTLRMILAVGIVFLLMTLIQSELLLKILLLLSMVFTGFLLYPYASVRLMAIRKKFFGPLYGYRNLNLSLTGERLTEIADSLQSLAEGFRTKADSVLGETDKNRLMEELSDKLCRECSECENCWSNKMQDSYRAVCELLELACRDGGLALEQIPQGMRESCVQAERYVAELNRLLEQEKQNRLLCRQQEESRGIIAEQLTQVAAVVRKSSRVLCGKEEVTELQKQALANFLHAERLQVREIALFFDRESGRELRIVAKTRRGVCARTKVLAEKISALLDIPMLSSEENRNVVGKDYAEYIFYEAPRYHVLTGIARCTRESGECSGDTYSFLRSGRRDAVMILADGMGSGVEAGRDSTMVVELLEQLLAAGFEESSVVKLLNTALMLRSQQVKFTTLDMGIVNLYTGNCEFVKAGAATTFIKRKNWVETITSTSVPLGFLDEVDCETKHKKLYHDDYVIMLSDGALDCIGLQEKEEYLEQMIAGMTERSPQEMAKQIMEGIAASPGYVPKDDITILVTGVFAA